MKNFTHRWTRSGHFFSKLGHFFFNFRKRTGETSSPSPPLVTRLWIDLVNKVSNARQRPPSRQKFLLAFATFRGITFQHVYSSGSTNILVTLLKFCDSSSSYYNETKYSKNIFRNSCFCIVRKCMKSYVWTSCYCTKMKFYFKDFFSKCDQIRRKPRIWSHLLKKSLMENFIFCAVYFYQSHRLRTRIALRKVPLELFSNISSTSSLGSIVA